MQTLTHEQKIARACYCLDHGRHGPEQARDTSEHLAELQDRGLAYCSLDGWKLTSAGRKMARAFFALISAGAPEE